MGLMSRSGRGRSFQCPWLVLSIATANKMVLRQSRRAATGTLLSLELGPRGARAGCRNLSTT